MCVRARACIYKKLHLDESDYMMKTKSYRQHSGWREKAKVGGARELRRLKSEEKTSVNRRNSLGKMRFRKECTLLAVACVLQISCGCTDSSPVPGKCRVCFFVAGGCWTTPNTHTHTHTHTHTADVHHKLTLTICQFLASSRACFRNGTRVRGLLSYRRRLCVATYLRAFRAQYLQPGSQHS